MTNRVRHSKQRLASKQLAQPIDTPSTDNTPPVGTWLNPAPAIIVNDCFNLINYYHFLLFS
jgi:hypothetical protein